MAVLADLSEEEKYLLAILQDQSGVDIAEMSWVDDTSPDFVFRCWDYQYCLTGDTEFYTSIGRRTLKESVGHVRLLTEDAWDRGKWIEAEVRSFGQGPIWEVELQRRGVTKTLRATPTHRWFVAHEKNHRSFDEVTTENLVPGMKLQAVCAPRETFALDREWVQSGIVFGDGTVSAKGASWEKARVNLWGEKMALASWFDYEPIPITNRPDVSVPGLYIGGLPSDYKTRRPSLIGPASHRWGWLAGYVATDGTVSSERQCVLASSDRENLEFVRDLCLTLGIVTGPIVRLDAHNDGLVSSDNPSFHLTLRAADLPDEFFLMAHHEVRAHGVERKRTRRVESWTVTSVRDTGTTEEVYCAVVPGTHSFVLADDILTGNSWYRHTEKFQIDRAGRALGKSLGIQLRSFAFPFTNAGQEMLITAPELIHLDPVTKNIEDRIMSARLGREFLKKSGTSNGFTHRPFEARFRNGASIKGRIPQKDGRGVKGSLTSNSAPTVNPVSVLVEDEGMLLTDHGLVPASEIKVGDLLYTHKNRFRPVEHIYRYETEAYEVAGAGHRGLLVSSNHRFYARRNSNPQRTRNLSRPTWVVVDDPEITKRWYWASPCTFPEVSEIDVPPVTHYEFATDAQGFRRQALVTTEISNDLLPVLFKVAGRYLADGSMALRNGKPVQVAFTDDESGIILIEGYLEILGLHVARRRHENAHCTTASSGPFCGWLYEWFGHLSDGKRLPGWVFGLPRHLRQALLDGYLAGDGHYNEERGRWEFGSASKALALGLKLLAQSLGHPTNFSWVDPKVKEIAGTELKNTPKRSYRVQIMEPGRGNGIIEDGFLWGRIRKVTPVGIRNAMDFVVAEDFSYVADGIVHRGSAFIDEDDE